MSKVKDKEKKSKANIIRNFFYAVRTIYAIDKSYIFQRIINAIFASISAFAYAYIIKIAVKGIEEKLEFKETVIQCFIVICIAFFISTVQRLLTPTFWQKSSKISVFLKRNLCLETLEIDYELLERPEIQDALEKATRHLHSYGGIMGLLNYGFWSIQYMLSLIIACSIVVSVNGWLILIILTLAVFKAWIENYNQRKEKEEFQDKTPPIWRKINYTDNISKNLTIGKDLRIYEMNKFIEKERTDAISDYTKIYKKNVKRDIGLTTFVEILIALDTLFLYGFMVYEVIYNRMKISDFTFMVSSVYTLMNCLYAVIRNNGHILRCSLQTNDYRNFVEIDYKIKNEKEELDAKSIEVEFQNVSYSYYMQEGFALHNISFKIKKGEKIALVGYNGAGKTTIIKLLCGLYHPTKGKILINGIDIETLTRDSLQKLIAPVFQETVMYAFEIAENIAMAYQNKVDYEKVKDVIRLVELDKKIDSLPSKVKTMITRDLDDKGIELSGGENQKLALARAVYKEAPLLILDEPTSAMDAISEYRLYHNFNAMIKTSSAIFISHRLSSTKFCDRILFLNKGKITEVGSHDELMKKNGEYKKLFDMQAEYYKGGDEDEESVS